MKPILKIYGTLRLGFGGKHYVVWLGFGGKHYVVWLGFGGKHYVVWLGFGGKHLLGGEARVGEMLLADWG